MRRAKARLLSDAPEAPGRQTVLEPDPQRTRSVPPGPYGTDDGPYWNPLIDPVRVVDGIWRARRIVVLTTLMGAVIGVMVALATPKEYYSATELLFDPRSLQLVDRELTGGALPSDATLALIENQVSIIRSGSVLKKVAERLELADDPEFNGQGGGLLGKLTNPRALLSFGDGGDSSDIVRHALAVQNLAESLNVERNPRTFIIHIGVTTQDPDKSALIAGTTAEVYLETSNELQAAVAGRANTEISSQLDELRAEVEQAEQAVADFKAEHGLFDAQGRLMSDDVIVRLNEQLSTARGRTAELNARISSMRELGVDQVLGGALPEQVASPVMTELLSQYAVLQQQADRAAVRLGPRHPDNQTVQAELAGLREAISAELRRVTASIQVELRRAVELEQDLAARLARMKAEKNALEDQQVGLRELEREAAARRSVYESFLLRARETGQQRNLETANVAIISEATPPLLPSGISRTSIVLAATFLGFLAGILLGAGMGAVASLRENTAKRRRGGTADPGPVRAHGEDQRGYGDDGFDPMPPSPTHTGRRHPLPAASNPAHGGWEEEGTVSIEDLRHSLRAFRDEIDALAERRTRRAG
ncbi:GumC family protein [Nitratireductor sp. GCM10026969]|uniref:GumC family protein n=1 Tax=Nitratireductor sp. GCM10026969 TaxID=3252645 RepID=UPI00361E68C2